MLGDLMGKIQEAQSQLEASKKKLDDVLLEESCSGVTVKMTAGRHVKDICISDELMQEGDGEQVADLLVIALNKLLEQGKAMEDDVMKSSAMDMLPNLGL